MHLNPATRRLPLVGLLLAVQLSGCGNRESADQSAVTLATADTADASDTLPQRIYYDLTRYAWYQRAEPLRLADRAYVPRGAPEAIPLAKLRLAGNYQGVDFYIVYSEREPPATVYVPVYRGYWLPFVAAPATRDSLAR